MEKHRALIVGAGRIGAGYNWSDEGYTHAGAVRALADRVELVGFVERDAERRRLAFARWEAPTYDSIQQAIKEHDPDIVSVCTQPEQQEAVVSEIIENHIHVNGLWVEKPWVSGYRASPPLIQVNYMRRADERHRELAERPTNSRVLIVYGKDDVHTKCHFEDLAEWWDCKLDYRVFNGPCSYAQIGRAHV